MGKYEPLGAFLREQRTPEVLLTFNEIEKITGVRLPPKAQHHRAWWSNNSSNNVMTKVWLAAGYQSSRVDMSARKLVFRRVAKSETGEAKAIFCIADIIHHLAESFPAHLLNLPPRPDQQMKTPEGA